jgi:hypothetical protein
LPGDGQGSISASLAPTVARLLAGASAGQNEGCERHLTSFSRCLDEPAPAQLLLAVDQALEVARDAAEDAGTVAAAVLRCR